MPAGSDYGVGQRGVTVERAAGLPRQTPGCVIVVIFRCRKTTGAPPMRSGAFIFVGNGNSAGLHKPAYDFNDEVIPAGRSYWARLVETAMPG
jgi:metal-dependent amidase/aminoacylase/carboxypeptidase family protein